MAFSTHWVRVLGRDRLVRSVRLVTTTTEYVRPITKVVLLSRGYVINTIYVG